MSDKVKVNQRVITEVTLPSGKKIGVSISQKGISVSQKAHFESKYLKKGHDYKLTQSWDWAYIQEGFDGQETAIVEAIKQEEAKIDDKKKAGLK